VDLLNTDGLRGETPPDLERPSSTLMVDVVRPLLT